VKVAVIGTRGPSEEMVNHKVGKVILCSIDSLDVTADIKLFITRVKPKSITGWTHVPQLAPSAKLFSQYIM